MINRLRLPCFVFILVATYSFVCTAQEVKFQILQNGDNFTVKAGDDLLTELDISNYRKPILYPVMGPGQTEMTRNHPMKTNVVGEADDHPHHKSIWFGHGDINGISFWHEEGLIQVDKSKPITVDVSSDGTSASISYQANLLGPDDKLVCTDNTKISFSHVGDHSIAIDWDTTIHASQGPLTFGDTKEGTMAIRTHPNLRIDKGGQAVNSNYGTGEKIWGKHAAWVDYSGKIGKKHVGIAIFDHPQNLRHPTTWHARAYGLVAANPFGLSDFEGKPKGTGDVSVPEGESLRFQYRFVIHEGNAEHANISQLYESYSKK